MDNKWLWYEMINLEEEHLYPVRNALINHGERMALEVLKDVYEQRTEPCLYFKDEDLEGLIAYVKLRCQEELALVMETADETVNNIFTFRFPWDMERSNESVRFEGEIRWDHIPAEDPEWTYMLNRHRYWIALGQAYVITQNEKYAEAVCRQMESWIDHNPAPEIPVRDHLTWRTIDAGIRCDHWIKTYPYIKRSPHFTTRLFHNMLRSLYEHGEYIASAPCTGWKRMSNWGVIENRGLFGISVFMSDWNRAEYWRGLSTQSLKETAELQVQKDGVHWEQSPLYHNEVLHCYMDYLILSTNNAITPEPVIVRTVNNMLYADLYMAKPNHYQPLQGDSDNNDLRETLAAGAVYFEDAHLKFGGSTVLSYDHAWAFGIQGITLYEELEARQPEHMSWPFVQTGNYVMRSGWSEQDAYLYFHCGFLGGGHGHADMLHFEMHAFGRDLLVDSGRYNYGDHTPWRKILKQCKAHNTTMVDHIDFNEYIDSWTNGRIAEPRDVFWTTDSKFDYVEGSHTGYFYLDDPVRPLRRILFIKPNVWLLCDSFECKEEHIFEQHFHFMPGAITVNSSDLTARTQAEHEANIKIIPVHPERLTCEVRDSMISLEYNSIEPNQAVTYRSIHTGFTSMLHVLYPQAAGSNNAPFIQPIEVMTYLGEHVHHAEAEAVLIRLDRDDDQGYEEHLILICHRKPRNHIDSYVVDGTQVFGEVVWIQRSEGTELITVIK